MLHICWWFSHDKKKASGAGRVNCMLHKRDLLTKMISSSRPEWKIPALCNSGRISFWAFVSTRSEHQSGGNCLHQHMSDCVTPLDISRAVRFAYETFWHQSNSEWFHIRLYMAMMCRQLSSCRLYSWILFTWTSNMEDGLIFTLYSFSRYWANFTLLSCEKNHKKCDETTEVLLTAESQIQPVRTRTHFKAATLQRLNKSEFNVCVCFDLQD